MTGSRGNRDSAAIRELLADVVGAAGADLEGVEVRSAGRRTLLRVSVDTDDGINLDTVAELTRVISASLDDSDVMGDAPYVLEVGSPGVSRPLTEVRHWRRNIGRLVRITLTGGGDPLLARVESVTQTPAPAVTVTASGTTRVVALADIRRAVVQVQFSPESGQEG